MVNHTSEEIRQYYSGRFGQDATKGDGQIYVRCPFHEDRNPSLSVNLETGLWMGHAGCGSGNVEQFEDKCIGAGLGEPLLTSAHGWAGPDDSGIETVFVYENKEGDELFSIVRRDFADKPRTFVAKHMTDDGKWASKLDGVAPVPYRLPEVVAAELVVICEGEKCADAVRALSLSGALKQTVAATCNPFGVGKWRQEYNEYFTGKRAVILPDNDEVGRNHAHSVAESLAGIAAEVKLVDLPGLGEKGDVYDFIQLQPQNAAPLLCELINAAPVWTAPKQAALPNGFVTLKDFNLRPKPQVQWLVDELLIAGGTSVLAAKPKVGKSVLVRQLAVAVSQGRDFLGRKTLQGGVIYVGLEDNAQKSSEHFAKLGNPDADSIVLFDAWQMATPQTLKQALRVRRDVVLVIVDTVFRMYNVKSADDYMEVTAAFNDIIEMSKQFNVHVCGLHHMGKKDREDIQDGILGSTAISGSVETIIMMLGRGKAERRIQTRQRYGHELEETKLVFDEKTQSSSLAAAIQSDILEEAPAVNTYERIRNEILNFVERYPGATEEAIMAGVAGKNSLRGQILREMVRGNALRRDGSGRKGSPYQYCAVGISIEDAPTVANGIRGNAGIPVQ